MMRQHAMFLLPPPVFLFLSLASSCPPFISSPLPLLPPSSFHSLLSLSPPFLLISFFKGLCLYSHAARTLTVIHSVKQHVSHYLFLFVVLHTFIRLSLQDFLSYTSTPSHVCLSFLFFPFPFFCHLSRTHMSKTALHKATASVLNRARNSIGFDLESA